MQPGPPPPPVKRKPWPVRLLSAVFATRGRRWTVIVVVICLVLGGIGAWAWWPAALRAYPGTVQASVLSPEEASAALGVTLLSSTTASEPPPALAANPQECTPAVGPATQAVYERGWTRFHSVTYQDAEDVADHVVTQVLGTYSKQEQAAEAFRTLSDGINNCGAAERTVTDQQSSTESTSNWIYEVYATTPDTLIWIANQDYGEVWSCYRQARLKGRTVLQVAVCGAGDGAPATAKITDQFAGRVGG